MGPLDLGHRWAPWPHKDSRENRLENRPFCGPQYTAAEPTVAPEEAFEDPPSHPEPPSPHTEGQKESFPECTSSPSN